MEPQSLRIVPNDSAHGPGSDELGDPPELSLHRRTRNANSDLAEDWRDLSSAGTLPHTTKGHLEPGVLNTSSVLGRLGVPLYCPPNGSTSAATEAQTATNKSNTTDQKAWWLADVMGH